MVEIVEDQSYEQLGGEGTDYEFSRCGKSKRKYTRASLLEFNEVEVCHKLPRNFDLLILRRLDGESDGTTEEKSISGNSSDLGPLVWTKWHLDLPGERWDSQLLALSKDSHLQRNCDLDRKNILCEQLPQGSADDAGVLGQKPQKSDPFKLSKSENPYRPPHCKKNLLNPSGSMSDPGKESSSTESDQIVPADIITGNDESGYEIPLGGLDDTTEKPLGECEDCWKDIEGNEVFNINETLTEIIEELLEDNQLTFDDFWEEILETIHPQLEPSISPTNSEIEICLSNDSLISVNHSTPPEDSSFINSEDEIILPDEDSLISIYDMVAPDSDPPVPNKVTSNTGFNIRKNSESQTITKRIDSSTRVTCKAQSFSRFPGLVTHKKLHSTPSHSQAKTDMFVGDCHANFPPMFMFPIIAPLIPTLNCFTQSNVHHQSYQENTLTRTKTNDSFFQYSVWNQPNIFPQQQNQLAVGTSCLNPTKKVATLNLSAMHSLPLTSREATY